MLEVKDVGLKCSTIQVLYYTGRSVAENRCIYNGRSKAMIPISQV